MTGVGLIHIFPTWVSQQGHAEGRTDILKEFCFRSHKKNKNKRRTLKTEWHPLSIKRLRRETSAHLGQINRSSNPEQDTFAPKREGGDLIGITCIQYIYIFLQQDLIVWHHNPTNGFDWLYEKKNIPRSNPTSSNHKSSIHLNFTCRFIWDMKNYSRMHSDILWLFKDQTSPHVHIQAKWKFGTYWLDWSNLQNECVCQVKHVFPSFGYLREG